MAAHPLSGIDSGQSLPSPGLSLCGDGADPASQQGTGDVLATMTKISNFSVGKGLRKWRQGGSRVQGQPWLTSNFQVRLDYMKSCQKQASKSNSKPPNQTKHEAHSPSCSWGHRKEELGMMAPGPVLLSSMLCSTLQTLLLFTKISWAIISTRDLVSAQRCLVTPPHLSQVLTACPYGFLLSLPLPFNSKIFGDGVPLCLTPHCIPSLTTGSAM